MRFWKHWKYKHLTYFLLSICVVGILSRFELFHELLLSLGDWGYVGALVAGILFVSTYTVSIGALVLLILAEKLNLIEIVLLAGFGGVLGDLFIFSFVKDHLTGEIKLLYKKFGNKNISHLLHSRYFSWTLPVLGAIIIASPFPDELGVSLMGITKMKTWKFILISFVLDCLAIILIVSASVVIKP